VTTAAIAIDGGDVALGGGLLALLRPALEELAPGGVVALLSSSPALRQDLPSWCRFERHVYLGCEAYGDRDRHLIQRGVFGVATTTTAETPDAADPRTGFAPRGARVEPGGPQYPFSLTTRAKAAPTEARALYDQAIAAQWDGARDIAWDRIRPLAPPIDRALGQVMTFLAENELAALYVPSQFVARLHPAYVETAMFLATQLADEARHIDVFLRRARLAGGLGLSTATTSRSLLSLLALDDFTEAAFLLSLLGEGTFLDLLRYIERFAPDEPTAEIMRRARADESRHVHFGVAHVRAALANDMTLASRLEAAVRRRAATLHGIAGVPSPIQDALTLLAAGSDEPRAVARGHEACRELLREMDEARMKRLVHAGFTRDQAQLLSWLHTPNFM
jgi:TusA-related sulfurtransferase